MPAVSEKQRRYLAWQHSLPESERKVHMSDQQFKEFMTKHKDHQKKHPARNKFLGKDG